MFMTSAVCKRERTHGSQNAALRHAAGTTDSVDTLSVKLTVCERFMMNDWIQLMTDQRIANADCKRSSRIWWSTVSKATNRSSNAVGKCSAKATKQLRCWSFDNVLTQSRIRNIELCCSCMYGHWTFCLPHSLLSQFHYSLHCSFTPTRSFCMSFVLVNRLLHSLQKSMPAPCRYIQGV